MDASARFEDLPCRLQCRIIQTDIGCWVWLGYVTPDGYGQVGWQGRVEGIHRVIYQLLVGPIPAGLDLDHLAGQCWSRSCCNPEHLEPVTRGENRRRSAAAVSHCPQGHPYAGANLYTRPNGSRVCRACKVVTDAKWRARRLTA